MTIGYKNARPTCLNGSVMITIMTMAEAGLKLPAKRSSTLFSERRSPDPAHWCGLDSRRGGDRRFNRNAIRSAHMGDCRAPGCDHLDTLVTREKIRAGMTAFFSYSHVYSLILTYSHIKNIFFMNGANSVPNSRGSLPTPIKLT